MLNNNILRETFNINRRYQRQKNQKEFNTAFTKKNTTKKNINIISKIQKNTNSKRFEDEKTHRYKNKLIFFDRIQNKIYKTIKREKSADHLKKRRSLRQKIQAFFNDYVNYDTNFANNINKKGKPNNKIVNNKNYNTLILFKKSKGGTLIEKKRKSYLSPDKPDHQNKNNFYKRLLNLRTVSSSKFNTNNNDIIFNHKENLNINNNYETNNINIAPNKIKNKSDKKKKSNNINQSKKNTNKKIKKYYNILYKSQTLVKKIGFSPQNNNIKIKYEKDSNLLTKSTNLNMLSKEIINNDLEDKQYSHEKIQVNKNEENNIINNYDKINVKKINSLINFNTSNNINNLMAENKINKNEEMCLTDENIIVNKDNEVNINNIKVCKSKEFKNDENKNSKEFKRNKSCKKPFEIKESLRESTSVKKIRYKNKNKTPIKESLFNLKNFKNLLIPNVYNNSNININNQNSEISYLYNIYLGNNGKLVEKVLKTRNNWEKIDSQNPQCANLIWTPLSCQINYSLHSLNESSQFVNHFEFHRELTNKASTFINLFRYCEFNDIDLFSFYPLTIILTSNLDYLQTQIEGFKRCYDEVPNLLYDINTNYFDNNINQENIMDNNKNNLNLLQDKYYINYFYVNLSKKIGTKQKIQIPKTFYSGKNLWMLKRTNLNRGREMKLLSDLDDIITQINSTFENNSKKQKPHNLIIQKYLESPLLYNGRKFDIRIWVLFTYNSKDYNINVYVFKEGHLKACCDEFNLDDDNLFIHLTNYSVQKYNKNFSKREVGNEISFKMFQDELNRQNSQKNFKRDIFPEIIKIIWITAKAGKNKINIMDRKNCFEIYGYDFILDSNYNPFLLEINTNPGLEESSPLIKMLVPRMIDDAFRLTIDKTFENGKSKGNKSYFRVEGYTNEENLWQKIKKI